MRRHGQARVPLHARPVASPAAYADWRIDWAAKALVIACVLNLNGVGVMMFGAGQTVSVLMLITASILVLSVGRFAWFAPFTLLVFTIVSYLILGTVFHDPSLTLESPSLYYRPYIGSILIIWGLAGYVASLPPGPRLIGFLQFIRNVLLVAAASVWASPILYQFYINLPFSSLQRMGGFFGNPNEAAFVSCLAVAVTLALPFQNRTVQIALLFMASAAVFLTFSKTGMTAVVVILTWHFLRAAKGLGIFLVLLGSITAIIIIQDFRSLLLYATEIPALDLDLHQKSRVMAVADILSGQIDEKSSTGRTYLWEIAALRGWQTFPVGSGLGSGHFIIGGILEHDVWQGTHNTPLMLWSEAGALPLVFLVLAFLIAIYYALCRAYGSIELSCLLILILNMSTTHSALAARYHNVMLAIVFGLLAGAINYKNVVPRRALSRSSTPFSPT